MPPGMMKQEELGAIIKRAKREIVFSGAQAAICE
ncbi:MAG: hypothetical protein QOE73_1756 [Verrucomicrobiota bacterium]|jgi:hypothetical protein